MSIVEVKNLKSSYNNSLVFEKINFKIEQGEYVCIVGENGSGKSTLVKTIMGLKKQDSGKIIFNIKPDEISYLEQGDLKKIDFPATAREIIMTGCQNKKKIFYTKEDKESFNKVVKELKIQKIVNKRIGDLSGGQKQRVLLARCLIRNPKLIILDEPQAGLDANITKELYGILEELNKNQKVTIIMVTHDLESLKNIKPRIICIANKTLKYDGSFENWHGNLE